MKKLWLYVVLAMLPLTSCALQTLSNPNLQQAIWHQAQARAAVRQGDYAKAEANYNEAIALYAKVDEPKLRSMTAKVTEDLAKLYLQQNNYKEAKNKFEAALAIYDKLPSTSINKQLHMASKAECLAQYAVLLRAMQLPEQAKQAEAQAKELRGLAEKTDSEK